MDVKEFKKIDAHAHIGEFGGWAKLSINAEQLIAQMDENKKKKTLLCSEPNEICLDAVEKYPDRFVGMVYPNPYDGQKAVDMIYDYVQNKGFKEITTPTETSVSAAICRYAPFTFRSFSLSFMKSQAVTAFITTPAPAVQAIAAPSTGVG